MQVIKFKVRGKWDKVRNHVKEVTSLEGNNLVVFYYPSASDI
jgi:hypothetical protein